MSIKNTQGPLHSLSELIGQLYVVVVVVVTLIFQIRIKEAQLI